MIQQYGHNEEMHSGAFPYDSAMIKGMTPPDSIRWLFIDFNSYFASVEQQLRPELRGKPIAVVPLETDATCAIAASYEAKAYGIRTGPRFMKPGAAAQD
jgi:impB/mucB/samB family